MKKIRQSKNVSTSCLKDRREGACLICFGREFYIWGAATVKVLSKQITLVLHQLQLLLIHFQAQFKGSGSGYLKGHLSPYVPTWDLRSSLEALNELCCWVSCGRLQGKRSFLCRYRMLMECSSQMFTWCLPQPFWHFFHFLVPFDLF